MTVNVSVCKRERSSSEIFKFRVMPFALMNCIYLICTWQDYILADYLFMCLENLVRSVYHPWLKQREAVSTAPSFFTLLLYWLLVAWPRQPFWGLWGDFWLALMTVFLLLRPMLLPYWLNGHGSQWACSRFSPWPPHSLNIWKGL